MIRTRIALGVCGATIAPASVASKEYGGGALRGQLKKA